MGLGVGRSDLPLVSSRACCFVIRGYYASRKREPSHLQLAIERLTEQIRQAYERRRHVYARAFMPRCGVYGELHKPRSRASVSTGTRIRAENRLKPPSLSRPSSSTIESFATHRWLIQVLLTTSYSRFVLSLGNRYLMVVDWEGLRSHFGSSHTNWLRLILIS
jgi:hypothetical protein